MADCNVQTLLNETAGLQSLSDEQLRAAKTLLLCDLTNNAAEVAILQANELNVPQT